MPFWTLLILAVGLAADAFAVSIGKGLQIREGVTAAAVVLGTAFGTAQAAMPIIGWLVGSTFADRVSRFAPVIAFLLLVAVGIKMLHEALTSGDDHGDVPVDESETVSAQTRAPKGPGHPVSGHGLRATEVLVLAIATSIDALAVGVSMAVLEVSIWWASAVIGVVTFTLSAAAVFMGHSIGSRYRRPAEIAGGTILVLIAIRVLVN